MCGGGRREEDGPSSSVQKPFCTRLEIHPSGKGKGNIMFACNWFIDALTCWFNSLLNDTAERLSPSFNFSDFFLCAYSQLS